MTGAYLGGRGARRRRSCSATAAPREGGRRRGHRDGRHHPQPQRGFFHQILIDVSPLDCLRTWVYHILFTLLPGIGIDFYKPDRLMLTSLKYKYAKKRST